VLAGFTVLLLFQLIGEVLVRSLGLPIPGPVVGMVLLFSALRLRKRVPSSVRDASQGLLRHLSLLFVPAGVGVTLHFARIAQEWLAIAVALFVSTILAVALTAWTMRLLVERRRPARQAPSPGTQD
jgi:holin-like protein